MENLLLIILINIKFVTYSLLAGLGQFECAESKNHIGCAQTSQTFRYLDKNLFVVCA